MPLGQRVAHMAPERCRCLQICAASVAAGAATPSVPRREKTRTRGNPGFSPRGEFFSRTLGCVCAEFASLTTPP